MTTQHTPAPWQAVEGVDNYPDWNIRDANGWLICTVADPANARLIAAVTQLLEACRLALAESQRADEHFKSVSPGTLALRTAIAKATGG